MKQFYLFLVFVSCMECADAQITFVKLFGDTFPSKVFKVLASNADYTFIATSLSTVNGNDVQLTKLDLSGNEIFTKYFGTSADEEPSAMCRTLDSGYIITASQINSGVVDALITKTDKNGNTQWTTMMLAGNIEYTTRDIVQDPVDSSYYIAGYGTEKITGDKDVMIGHVSKLGEVLYCKVVGTQFNEETNSVIITSDNNILVAGNATDTVNGGTIILLAKFQKSGSLIFSNIYDSNTSFNVKIRTGNDVIEDNNNYLITGSIGATSFGSATSYILSVDDTAGQAVQWCRSYPLNSGSGNSSQIIKSNSGYVLASTMGNNSPAIIKTDLAGQREWSYFFNDNSFNNYGYAYAIDNCTDGGFVLAGELSVASSLSRGLVMKLDATGTAFCNTRNTFLSGSASEQITVKQAGFYKSNITSGNWGLGNQENNLNTFSVSDLCSVGISGNTTATSAIYPNPSKGLFIVESAEDSVCKVYSTLGELILQTDIKDGKSEIDLSGYSNGVYFIKTESNSQAGSFMKLVKQ